MGYNNNFGIPKGSQPLYPRDGDTDISLSKDFKPSAGFGIAINKIMHVRRSGDAMVCRGYFTAGTVANSATYITLPSGLNINVTKMPNANITPDIPQQAWWVGQFQLFTSGGSPIALYDPTFHGNLFYAIGDSRNIYLSLTTTGGAHTSITGTSLMASSDSVGFEFTVPIAEWTVT